MTLAYMSKETEKTVGDKRQPIRKEVSYPAQKLALEVSLTDVVQRLIDPAAIPNWFSISQEGMNELAAGPIGRSSHQKVLSVGLPGAVMYFLLIYYEMASHRAIYWI